jgi:hypothetical protein
MINRTTPHFNITRPLIYYPWLILVFFILKKFDLFTIHPKWSTIILFLTVNSLVLLLVYKILLFFLRERLKAWMLASVMLIFILYYPKLIELLSEVRSLKTFLTSLPGLTKPAIFLLLYFLIVILFNKYKGPLVELSKYLNILLIVLILYILFAIYSQNPDKITLAEKLEISEKGDPKINSKLPDIYYIILDAYTSNQSLKDYWNYDNDPFTNFLIDKGFHVATGSKTNYNITEYSLSSSLNMSYLDNIPRRRTENPVSILNLKNLTKNSQVIKFAAKNGYHITNLSFFDLPGSPSYYDDFYTVKRSLIDGTTYRGFLKRMSFNFTDVDSRDKIFELEKINPGILNSLKVRDKKDERPNFIYAHVMMPHDPYLFDEFGRIHENDSVFINSLKDRYLGQLKYANKLLTGTVDSILKNYSSGPVVIIIQGDHGYRYLPQKNKIDESMTILNAYYFSDGDYTNIYNSISPVNTFRVVFNKYMDAGLPLIKDVSHDVFYISQ